MTCVPLPRPKLVMPLFCVPWVTLAPTLNSSVLAPAAGGRISSVTSPTPVTGRLSISSAVTFSIIEVENVNSGLYLQLSLLAVAKSENVKHDRSCLRHRDVPLVVEADGALR